MFHVVVNAPLAVRAAKRAVNRGYVYTAGGGYQLEARLLGGRFDTADLQEGISAFLATRPPRFRGA